MIKRIVFVCLGNICRSPMAEAIMKQLLKENNLEKSFQIDSMATSFEEAGNSVYPLAQDKLKEKGILNFTHQAKVFRKGNYDEYDYIVGMEDSNIYDLMRIVGGDKDHKIRKLIEQHNIKDPWYTRNFEVAYQEIKYGCQQFLKELIKREGE